MKKLILTSLIIFSSLFLINTQAVHAQMGSMMGLDNQETEVGTKEGHAESVEVVLQSILESQNVSTVQELDLSKVSDDDWEHLGDAVMEIQHPGEAHEVMDQMMGGEGSESLRQMHINMGKAYLGVGDNNFGPGMMMGGGMMRFGNNRNLNAPTGMMGLGSMMGYKEFGVHSTLSFVTWLLAIAFLASGTYFFIKNSHKK